MKKANATQALEEARTLVEAWSLEDLLDFREGLEEDWTDFQIEEGRLIQSIKDEFRRAGATEAQLAWGMLENVRVGFRSQIRLARLFRKKDELTLRAIPTMCLAAACNERIKVLEG